MKYDKDISTDSSHVLAMLPTGVALFDADGILVDANPHFLSAMRLESVQGHGFDELFGIAVTAARDCEREPITLYERHFALSLHHLAGGVLCHLHDVSHWVEGQAAARASSACDPLTGLGNRSALLPELERAVANPACNAALLMIDLDHFKKINDTLGHPVGDSLLRKVSDRLSASLRTTDRVARLGGDEFAVLQTEAAQPNGAETLAKRLVDVVGRPYVIDGHMIDIGASVGVALAGATHDSTALMKQADIALYRAKNAGRGRYTFFEQSMDEEMQERRALEIDLRRALAFRQFELHYQPQMDLVSGSITGVEALIRWRHPTRGLVSPASFIPLAEETGLIIPIGEWVVRQACEHAAGWPMPVSVAVNVSAKQLASGKLVNTVASAITNAGITPDRLEIEITESVLMADTQGCVATLHALRDLGVRVSMDDFGTGYSSLSYLHSFPFHTIKIDQSFIRSGDTAKGDAIIRAITAIGRHLGMATIAEGVETSAQLSHVAETGCGSAQGYHISRPVPADEVKALLDRLRTDGIEGSGDLITAEVVPPAEPDLYRLVYYSRNAIMGLDEEVRTSVDAILEKSQRNNAEAGVTGALMFTDGQFAQVLEGARGSIERVFERIQLDDRHGDVQLLAFERVDRRIFANWSMAFVGASRSGAARFGHYARASGFDPATADGDTMTEHLRVLLVEEEGLSVRAAA